MIHTEIFKSKLTCMFLKHCTIWDNISSTGRYHDVDSSDFSFNRCGYYCIQDTIPQAGVLVEPYMTVEVCIVKYFKNDKYVSTNYLSFEKIEYCKPWFGRVI